MLCIHTLLMYYACMYEMFRSKLPTRYVNSQGARSTADYGYLLTHGLSERAEDRIFVPRSWCRHFDSKAGTDSASLLLQVSRSGYARSKSPMDVEDLVDD